MGTALVVEDDITQQMIICKVLKRIGLNVIFAGDGIEAIELIQHQCPDLVILDIVMPQMNGYEVCRRIKSEQTTDQLPVLMFSTHTENINFSWGSKQVADAYVSKPCRPQELVDAIMQLLPDKVGLTPLL